MAGVKEASLERMNSEMLMEVEVPLWRGQSKGWDNLPSRVGNLIYRMRQLKAACLRKVSRSRELL